MYLFNGDSHRFHQDRPLAEGSPGSLSTACAVGANLRRVTVDGADLGEADWLKVTVQPRGRDRWPSSGARPASPAGASRGLRAAR